MSANSIKPKIPPKDFVCNRCYQLYHELGFQDEFIEVGPRFNGTTIIHFRKIYEKDLTVYHVYNSLSPIPFCQGLTKPGLESWRGNPTNYDLRGKGMYIYPCPDGMSEFCVVTENTFRIIYPNEKINSEVPVVFTLLNFIIDRLTRIAPQNDGVVKKSRWGHEYIPKPELNKKDILIGGSFALHVYQTYFEKHEKDWIYNDVDMFFIDKQTSANKFHIRCSILAQILGSILRNDWVATFDPPDDCSYIPKMQFVRTNCESVQDFSDSIDISVTGMVIVHSSAKISDEMIVLGEVPYLINSEKEDGKWILVCNPKSLEDIKAKRQTYYRKSDEFLFSKCLRRVAKYSDRGFTTIVHEPKELKCSMGGYNNKD